MTANNSIPHVALNRFGDALILRGPEPALFLPAELVRPHLENPGDVTPILIRDSVGIALITMMIFAHADFDQPSAPRGCEFILEFKTPRTEVRSAYLRAEAVSPTLGQWLRDRYDLVVFGNRLHLLSAMPAAFAAAASAQLAGPAGHKLAEPRQPWDRSYLPLLAAAARHA